MADFTALPQKTPFKISREAYLAIGAFIIIIAAIILILNISFFLPCDFNCFVEKAGKCEQASFTREEAGSTILYKIEKNCTLIKSISEFGNDEPAEVIALFQNKKMFCSYTKGQFNPEFVSSLVGGIYFCKGDLSDAIFALRQAQAELVQAAVSE